MALTAPVRIDTPRVRLRRLTADDVTAIFEMYSHPDVTRYGSAAAYTEIAQAEKRVAEALDHYAKDTAYPLAVMRIADERVIGNCTLWNFHRQNRRAEVGYALARPYWGQGYNHEAMTAMIDFAFREMQLHRLEADIDPRNVPSARTLERLGFHQEGLLRERWIVDGEVSDSALYGLLASEWRGPVA
ncbi:MAG: GNAT family N-acetyltransferase [Betaproteobacteria bacterium]